MLLYFSSLNMSWPWTVWLVKVFVIFVQVAQLKKEMKEVDDEYNIMLAELEALRGVKKEKGA